MKRLITDFVSVIVGFTIGVILSGSFFEKIRITETERANRNGYIFRTACKWLRARQRGLLIIDRLAERGIKKIAIYGVGELGRCLIEELRESDIKIQYLIDKNMQKDNGEYTFYRPKDILPEVQAVIVTPVYQYGEIVRELKYSEDTQIISLEELIS